MGFPRESGHRRFGMALAVVTVAASVTAAAPAPAGAAAESAIRNAGSATAVPGSYIAVLDDRAVRTAGVRAATAAARAPTRR